MSDKAAILAEMIELTRVPCPDPDEFTVREFLAAGGQGNHATAQRRLKLLEKKGVLTSRLVLADGKVSRAYKRVATDRTDERG